MAAAFKTMSVEPSQARKGRRSSLSLPAVIRLFGRQHDARLHNLSCGGAMIESEAVAHEGDPIDLVCGGIETLGEVVWVRTGRFGLAFLKPLDEDEILLELQRLDASARRGERRIGRSGTGSP
jgi:hypothetical protein